MGWSAVRLLLFGVLIWLCIWLALLKYPDEAHGRYAWLFSINAETNGWVFFMLFGACGLGMAFNLALSVWHFFIDAPAVALRRHAIEFHRSFAYAPDSIPYSEIQKVVFARADRLPKGVGENLARGISPAGAWGGTMGAKCRSGLRIYYRGRNYKDKYVTIRDNMIEGGEPAILSFGATLRQTMRKRGLKIRQ